MHASIIAGLSLAAAVLAGCRDDESVPADSFCDALGGPGATTSTACVVNCGQDNVSAAVDGRFETWAVLHTSVQNEGVLRGNAADGTVIPAGGLAGVYLHKPPLVSGTFQIALTTYRDGVVVDSDVAYGEGGGTSGSFCNHRCEPHGDNLFIGIPAEGAYDAIEIAYTQSGGTQSRQIRLYEFCTRPG